MRRSSVVGAVLGLAVLAAVPVAAAAPSPAVERPGPETEVHAALDIFLEIKGLKAED